MGTFETTATAAQNIEIDEAIPNTPTGQSYLDVLSGTASTDQRVCVSFRLPDKPRYWNDIERVTAVLTVESANGTPGTRNYQCYRTGVPFGGWTVTSGTATWNSYQHPGLAWATAGGDLDELASSQSVSGSYGASYVFDITALDLTWEDNVRLIIKDASEGNALLIGYSFFNVTGTGTAATVAWKPHVVVRFTDDPPDGINDLRVEPDISLSEASYTFRQRATIKWNASSADDFYRYRLRKGVNRSQASDHTHLAFVYSRASTAYLDGTLYTDSSTIYYSIYPEDRRNGSTSTALGATYCNVSNIVSWRKPDAVIGSISIGSSASTLQEIEMRVRTSTMANAKKAKIVWGDNGVSYTDNLTSAGGYLYARHRYTKATAGYTIRAQIEDTNGFRSGVDSYGTGVTISNLGPVSKIIASPSRQRTASTYSFGNSMGAPGINDTLRQLIFDSDTTKFSNADGIATSFRFRTGTSAASFAAVILRDEGDHYRVTQIAELTTATTATEIRKSVNLRVNRGDILAIYQRNGVVRATTIGTGYAYGPFSAGSAIAVNTILRKYARVLGQPPIIKAYAHTNPVHFSAKDSFARGSNRVINRFRWAPNYAGDFGVAYGSGGSYTTGATSSFYWAWTTATSQFVAVRAVDDTHSSSLDVVGVTVETEATFRIPDDIRDVVTERQSIRQRSYGQSRSIMRDYGYLELGNIEPRTIQIRGHATTRSSTTNNLIDIERISAVFQQRKRIYILPGESAATYVQGYAIDAPVMETTDDPAAKRWSMTIAVAT